MTETSNLPHDLARAARALTQVSAKLVAAKAGLDKHRLREFERGMLELGAHDQTVLRAALESYGVVFIDDGPTGGYGVRRKFSATKARRLEVWEGEGGPVADDSI